MAYASLIGKNWNNVLFYSLKNFIFKFDVNNIHSNLRIIYLKHLLEIRIKILIHEAPHSCHKKRNVIANNENTNIKFIKKRNRSAMQSMRTLAVRMFCHYCSTINTSKPRIQKTRSQQRGDFCVIRFEERLALVK